MAMNKKDSNKIIGGIILIVLIIGGFWYSKMNTSNNSNTDGNSAEHSEATTNEQIPTIDTEDLKSEAAQDTTDLELPISEYKDSTITQYNLVLEIPSNWGEVNFLADRGGYGLNEEEGPWAYEIFGEHYTIVITTHKSNGARSDEPIFMITSIPKEEKNNKAIPETDKYLTEYGDYAYFVRIVTDKPHLLESIPSILDSIKFTSSNVIK